MLAYSGFYYGQRVRSKRRYGRITGIVERDGVIRFRVKLDNGRPREFGAEELRPVRLKRKKKAK